MESLIPYVKKLVHPLVDYPQEVKISSIEGKSTLIYELRCHQKDVGKIIGKNGKTVSAIRLLLNTAASRQKRKALLEIVE